MSVVDQASQDWKAKLEDIKRRAAMQGTEKTMSFITGT
jgi:hypothetical protein